MSEEFKIESGEWGFLEQEPCRFCHKQGCVFFIINEGPHKNDPQYVCCEVSKGGCGRIWEASSTNA